MGTPDYLPKAHAKFFVWQSDFYDRVNEKLNSFKIDAAKLKDVTTAKSKYEQAFERASNPDSANRADRVERNERIVQYRSVYILLTFKTHNAYEIEILTSRRLSPVPGETVKRRQSLANAQKPSGFLSCNSVFLSALLQLFYIQGVRQQIFLLPDFCFENSATLNASLNR